MDILFSALKIILIGILVYIVLVVFVRYVTGHKDRKPGDK